MTLDEAIRYYQEEADDHEINAEAYKAIIEEDRQLAEWLRELKAYRETLANADRIIEARYGCVIIEGYADVIDQMREVNADEKED